MTAKSHSERIGVFAGSFCPFTVGHADIVDRALQIFERVHICIGVNAAKANDAKAAQERAQLIRSYWPSTAPITVDCWEGLTADYAAKVGATHLIRGVRSVKDYEYERDMADANHAISGLDTVILFSSPKYAYVTSSLVRELQSYGKDVSEWLPKKAND